MQRRRRYPRKDRTVRDHFGQEIEPGDRYFYGSPPTHGIVVKLTGRTMLLDIGADFWDGTNRTMKVKSPDKGVCLDKIPLDIWLQPEP